MQLSLISLALTKVYGGVAAFSPSSLFASGEQGVWYDPSDLSTMFQDSAGTTPVTADGQPVGLILDKSQGLVLGSEMITVTANRDFSSDTGFWVKGTGASISGGKANFSSASGWSLYRTSFGVSAGNLYEVSLTISGYSAGTIKVACGSTPGYSATFAANGTYTVRLGPIAGGDFGFVTSSFTGSIDDISVKAVSGNHASQATASSRPLYKTSGGLHWLQFDGVDDSLSTAAIDFTSTDKMSVFFGSYKASNAAVCVPLELSVNWTANAGTFYMSLPENAGGDERCGSRGLATINANQVSNFTYQPTGKAVFTQIHDISGDITKFRKNIVASSDAVGDKGAGNFGNYPLYIAARGGSSLFGNINIYSLIVRGALSTTQEITDTETWVNSKCGAY